MKFQSRWRNATYVIRKSHFIYHEGLGKELVPGLIAKFKGPQRLFDSAAAQDAAEPRWTEEERALVENRLLGHKDFGRGIYLAPGEEIPEDKVQYIRDKTILARTKIRCQHLTTTSNDIEQCSNEAQLGARFCAEHDPERSVITKGMLTSDGSTMVEGPTNAELLDRIAQLEARNAEPPEPVAPLQVPEPAPEPGPDITPEGPLLTPDPVPAGASD